jgi:hypothetical protein
MQEIMQLILQFYSWETARSIVLRCFGGDIAAFPSLRAWIDSVKEVRLAGAFIADPQKKGCRYRTANPKETYVARQKRAGGFTAAFFARDARMYSGKETAPTLPAIESWVYKPLRVLIVEVCILFPDAAGIADAAAAGLEARRAPHVRNSRNFKLPPILPEDALRVHHTRLVTGQLHRDIDFHRIIPPAR